MLLSEEKQKIIKKFAINKADTGSSEVQVAILTERITGLKGHFKEHKKDNHSRRGLLQMVSQRRRHLKYLKENKLEAYKDLIGKLGLRK